LPFQRDLLYALVELAVEARDPFRRWMMPRMYATRRVMDEPGAVWRDLMQFRAQFCLCPRRGEMTRRIIRRSLYRHVSNLHFSGHRLESLHSKPAFENSRKGCIEGFLEYFL
jgi:hypothetical protein